jgi:hypothetical protein
MCGGAILSGFIPPSGVAAAAAAKKKQQQRCRVTADLLWPGPGRKGAPQDQEEDFEADFREFERGLAEDDVDSAGEGGDPEVQELPPPEPTRFAFATAAKAAVGEYRIKVATSFSPYIYNISRADTHTNFLDGRKKDASFYTIMILNLINLRNLHS